MKGFIGNIIRSVFGVLTSRVLGLVRDVSIAAVFGATAVTDLFFVAFAIPNLLRALFAEGALSSAFVPILGQKLRREDGEGERYLSGLMIYTSIFILFILFLTFIFSRQIITIFMPGYISNINLIVLGSNLLKIVMPYLLFITVSSLLSGYLNLKGSFYIPYSSTALLNICMILAVLASYYMNKNIYYLAFGVFFGGILQVIYLYIFAFRSGYKFVSSNYNREEIFKTFKLILPSVFGVGINQLNFLIGRVLASFLSYGSISYLYYANRLFQFPFGLFSVTIGTVSLTELSSKDSEKRQEIINKALISIFLIIIPSTIGIILLADDIVRLIFQRNAFKLLDTLNTSMALIMYSSGLLFFSLNMTFTKVFHSMLDTKTPVKVSSLLLVCNTVFSILFLKSLQHSGIALSATISALIGTVCYIYLLQSKGIFSFSIFLKDNFTLLIKVVVANIFLVCVILIMINYDLNVLLLIALAAIFYYLILIVLKINVWKVLR